MIDSFHWKSRIGKRSSDDPMDELVEQHVGGPDTGQLETATSPPDSDVGEYGQLEFDDEIETALRAAESIISIAVNGDISSTSRHASTQLGQPDIEDMVTKASPFELFRGKGFLSVSDLVGPVWCEVQFDYRLRSLPHLPPNQRPDHIESAHGKVIPMDKVKVDSKERILRRGEVIHKRLEKEIYPVEIKVNTSSREDVWALRFLNMFSALEALIAVGTCRELPVVGFVGDILVRGVIDEIKREPEGNLKPETRSSRQLSLHAFFGSQKSAGDHDQAQRTHRIILSDSKTRVSGTVPREEDTLAGRLQLMLYKELLDGLLLSPSPRPPSRSDQRDSVLPSSSGFDWDRLWTRLDLDPDAILSETFVAESRPIIHGNGLRWGTSEARSLNDQVQVWSHYVRELGLGRGSQVVQTQGASPVPPPGTSDLRLELVYRRASAKQAPKVNKRQKRPDMEATTVISEPNGSLPESHPIEGERVSDPPFERMVQPLEEQQETELCDDLEVLRSMVDDLPEASSPSRLRSASAQRISSTPSNEPKLSGSYPSSASGGIIGRSRFKHDPHMLETHLRSVVDVWMGRREPVGVTLNHINRCAWCEFEDGCEWRTRKAEEAIARARRRAAIRASTDMHIA